MTATNPLSALDFAFIGLYFAVVLGAGLFMGRFAGVASGLCIKFVWPSLSWEAGTFLQVGVCFIGYFAGALFGTSKRERETKEVLFKELS